MGQSGIDGVGRTGKESGSWGNGRSEVGGVRRWRGDLEDGVAGDRALLGNRAVGKVRRAQAGAGRRGAVVGPGEWRVRRSQEEGACWRG